MKFKTLSILLSLTAFITAPLKGQVRFIRGTVMSAEAQVIQGAEIRALESGVTTYSDGKGKYTLVIGQGVENIVVSAEGYKSKKITVPFSSDIVDPTLELDLFSLEKKQTQELGLITNRYQSSSGIENIGGSFSSASTSDFGAALSGRLSGGQILTTNGGSTSSAKIQLRGIQSFIATSQPLIIVDGIPIDYTSCFGLSSGEALVDFGNRLNDLIPENIESVDVIYGSSGAILYGSRAANGAVIITTKPGTLKLGASSKDEIVFQSSYSVEDLLRKPQYQNAFGQGVNGLSNLQSAASWGPRLTGESQPWGQNIAGDQQVKPYAAVQSPLDPLFSAGHTLNNFVSFKTGSEKSGMYLSISDLRNTGVIQGTSRSRTSMQLNAYSAPAKGLSLDFRGNYTAGSQSAISLGDGYSIVNNALQTPVDVSLKELKDVNNAFNAPAGFYNSEAFNPWYVMANSSNSNSTNNILASATAKYKAGNIAEFTCRLGTNYWNDDRNGHQNVLRGVTGQNANFAKNPGLYYTDKFGVMATTIDVFATRKFNIVNNINLDLLAGYGYFGKTANVISGKTNGLNEADIYTFGNSLYAPTLFESSSNSSIHGLYARIAVDYKSGVFLTFTGRNDRNDVWFDSSRNAYNAGANIAILVNKWVKMPQWLPFAKLRGGYAVLNQLPDFNLMSGVWVPMSTKNRKSDTTLASPFGNRGSLQPANDLKAETVQQFEAGLDLSFFKDQRLGVSATFYQSQSSNLVCFKSAPDSTGYDLTPYNSGGISNQGIQLLVKYAPILNKDWRWDVGALFFANASQVTKTGENNGTIVLGNTGNTQLAMVQGSSVGQIITSDFVYNNNQVVVDKATGKPLVNPYATQGSYLPKYTFSLNSNLKYKNWSLYIQVDHRNGGKIYSRTAEILQSNGAAANTLSINGSGNERLDEAISNSVYLETDGNYYANDKAIRVQDYWNSGIGSLNVLEATFTKLREVQLRYELPKEVLNNAQIQGFTIGLTGRNLLLFTPKKNSFIDPEISSFGSSNIQGMANGSLSGLRSIAFFVKISL